jgi:hypothetical protein
VKHIIDRLCGGSAEQLVIGLVDSEVLGSKQLERLARKIAQSEEQNNATQRKAAGKPEGRQPGNAAARGGKS